MQPFPYFTIVDRYFVRSLLVTTFMCLASVVGIMLLFEILQRADSIPDLFRKYSWNALTILGQYYAIRVLYIFRMMGIYLILLGLTITFYRMERNSTTKSRGGEVIPMLTSGFSRVRVAIPFFYTSFGMLLFLTVAVELFFPFCADWPGANSSSFTPEKISGLENRRDKTSGITFSGESLDLEFRQVIRPRLYLPRSYTEGTVDNLSADLAQWVEPSAEHPGGYILKNVDKLEDKGWLYRAMANGKPVGKYIFPTKNLTWITEEEGDLFVVSMMKPEFLRNHVTMFVPVSLRDIYQKIHEPSDEFQLPLRVQLHSRLLKPLLDLSLIFMAVPIILSARLRSKLVVALLLGGLVLFFQFLPMFCVKLGERGIVSPFFAAWIPIFVFYTFASVLFEELYT